MYSAVGTWILSYSRISEYDGDGQEHERKLTLNTDGSATASYWYTSSSSRGGGLAGTDWKTKLNASGTWKAVSKDGAEIKAADCKPKDLVGATLSVSFPETVECETSLLEYYPGSDTDPTVSKGTVKVGEVSFKVESAGGMAACHVPGTPAPSGEVVWEPGELQAE